MMLCSVREDSPCWDHRVDPLTAGETIFSSVAKLTWKSDVDKSHQTLRTISSKQVSERTTIRSILPSSESPRIEWNMEILVVR